MTKPTPAQQEEKLAAQKGSKIRSLLVILTANAVIFVGIWKFVIASPEVDAQTPVEAPPPYSETDAAPEPGQESEANQGLNEPAQEKDPAPREEPDSATVNEERQILPTFENMQLAQACANESRIPGGGYCVDWYFGCLKDTFGNNNTARLGIPQDPMFYNQLCMSYGRTPFETIPRPR